MQLENNNNNALRNIVKSHLGAKTETVSRPIFEKAKTELITTKTTLFKSINLLTFERYLEVTDQSIEEADHDEKNATDVIDSYFIPLPSESINAAFARAKKESISRLKSEASQLKYFTYKDFSFKKKLKTPGRKIRATNFDNVRVEKKRSSSRKTK